MACIWYVLVELFATKLNLKVCLMAFTLFTIPFSYWIDLSMDFVFGLLKNKHVHDSMFIDVDYFFKIAHFIACHKVHHACKISNLLFKEVVKLHGIPKSTVSDRTSSPNQ